MDKSEQENTRFDMAVAELRLYEERVITKREEITKQQAELKMFIYDSEKWNTQTAEWERQKLCPHCGGALGIFGRKCKVCKKTVSMPVKRVPTWEARKAILSAKEMMGEIIPPEVHALRIPFGGYDWRVLDIEKGKALLLSDKIIECRAYAPGLRLVSEDSYEHYFVGSTTTWFDCSLRRYLNAEFYQSLNEHVKARIAETTVVNGDNFVYKIDGGKDTHDKIFLLSIDEAVRYFQGEGLRIAKDDADEAASWWLRSPGCEGYNVATVVSGGYINWEGSFAKLERGVRPALWLSL